MEALAPFHSEWSRTQEDPQPLDYLDSEKHRESGAINIDLEVLLQTEAMRPQEPCAPSDSRAAILLTRIGAFHKWLRITR